MEENYPSPSSHPSYLSSEDGGFFKLVRIQEDRSFEIMEGERTISEITGKIIGCAMEVHSHLGNGFQEVIYHRALAIEMTNKGLQFVSECERPIFYKGVKAGSRRVDFYVEDRVMVEIKAIIQLENVHLAQAINYLEAYDMQTGLLLNFGSIRLQFKRVMKPFRNNPELPSSELR